MMTEWFQKSIDALNLNGKAERTQEAYTRALRMLCEFYANKPPEAITEAELEAYFLRRKNVDRWSSNTMRISRAEIDFKVLDKAKSASERAGRGPAAARIGCSPARTPAASGRRFSTR